MTITLTNIYILKIYKIVCMARENKIFAHLNFDGKLINRDRYLLGKHFFFNLT